jgi:replicative DNA helicase
LTASAIVPPSDLDAEASVLCAIFDDSSAIERVRAIVAPEQFYADRNRWIYGATLALADAGQPTEPDFVARSLRDSGKLEAVGGTPYLAQLAGSPAVSHVEAHAHQVVRMWAKRRLVSSGQELAAKASNGGEPAALVDALRADIERVEFALRPRERPEGLSVTSVIDAWAREGSLVHEPTGIGGLDAATGGGPCYGTRWYVAGAPDAGKTAFLVQLAHVFATRGIAVGILAVDEEAGDVVTRFAQRVGYGRHDCEIREATMLRGIREALEGLPLRIYDNGWTIEAAAADLATFARSRGDARAMLAVDSIQTVRCEAESLATLSGRDMSEVAAVTARVSALRACATRHRLIAIATSELGRGAYRSGDPEQQTATLAAGKWSGSIEYSARVLLGLRSVAGETDLVDIEIAKNKHGPRDQHVYMRIDRPSQTLIETTYVPEPKESRATDRQAAARGRVTADAAIVARLLHGRPGVGVRELRAAVRANSGLGVERVDAALEALGPAVTRGSGARGARPMSLDISQLPAEIRTALEGS